MNQPDFDRAKQYALKCLEQSLPAALCYHSVSHTRDGVVPAADRLAADEGVDHESRLLLITAAWYHDIGFTEQRDNHEAIGVRIAATVLPEFGYTVSQIEMIGGMIMATRLPQAPATRLEEVLADADLDVLGRSGFLSRNHDLRTELATFGLHMTNQEWYRDQLQFLQNHQYWTAAARRLRNEGKRRNIDALAALLAQSWARAE